MSPSVSRRILISPWLIGGLNGHFLPRLPWKYFRNPLRPSRLTQRWSQDHWLLWLSPKILNRLGRGVHTLTSYQFFIIIEKEVEVLFLLQFICPLACMVHVSGFTLLSPKKKVGKAPNCYVGISPKGKNVKFLLVTLHVGTSPKFCVKLEYLRKG